MKVQKKRFDVAARSGLDVIMEKFDEFEDANSEGSVKNGGAGDVPGEVAEEKDSGASAGTAGAAGVGDGIRARPFSEEEKMAIILGEMDLKAIRSNLEGNNNQNEEILRSLEELKKAVVKPPESRTDGEKQTATIADAVGKEIEKHFGNLEKKIDGVQLSMTDRVDKCTRPLTELEKSGALRTISKIFPDMETLFNWMMENAWLCDYVITEEEAYKNRKIHENGELTNREMLTAVYEKNIGRKRRLAMELAMANGNLGKVGRESRVSVALWAVLTVLYEILKCFLNFIRGIWRCLRSFCPKPFLAVLILLYVASVAGFFWLAWNNERNKALIRVQTEEQILHGKSRAFLMEQDPRLGGMVEDFERFYLSDGEDSARIMTFRKDRERQMQKAEAEAKKAEEEAAKNKSGTRRRKSSR